MDIEAAVMEKNISQETLPIWDLSDLYLSIEDPEIENDLNKIYQYITQFSHNYRGKIEEISGEDLLQSILDYEGIDLLMSKVGIYSFLIKAINMNDENVAIFSQKIREKGSEFANKLTFYELDLIKLSDEQLNEKFKQEPKLEKYQPFLRDLRIFKKHVLPEEQEKILTLKSVTGRSAWVRFFDELMTKLRFDFQGKQVNESEILNKLSSREESERKEAYFSLGKTLAENSDTLSMITNVLAKDKAISDDLRGYEKPISSRNLSNFILDDEVVDTLLQTVKENYSNTLHRYYQIKAKIFGDEKLQPWNIRAPLPNAVKQEFSWDQAKKIVIDSYGDFSQKMGKMSARFFDENWIDAQVRDGKRSGAFAMCTYEGLHPFVLTNFQGKARDVATISHEIGHGLHFMFSETQGILMQNAPLILAETASVFGEQLTFEHMKEQLKSDQDKFYLLAGKIEDYLATIFRQVMFARFETKVHDVRKNGELSKNDLIKIWNEENKLYFGDAVDHGDEYNYYWSYIPHFIHTPFYVYAYAFGNCFVNALYKYYQDNPENFEQKYIEVLSAGSTLHYDEIMQKFDMQPKSMQFWQGSINMVIEMIDELELIGKKIGLI